MNSMMARMASMKVRFVYEEDVLGMTTGNKKIYDDFFGKKAPDAPSREEEIEAQGVEVVKEKTVTVFPRDEDGDPIFWDYQIKGSFKDACGGLSRAKGTKSGALTAGRKTIDNLVFVSPRKVKIETPVKKSREEADYEQRPIFVWTPSGPETALACSETVPAGSTLTFTVHWMELKEGKPPKKAKSTKAKKDEVEVKVEATPEAEVEAKPRVSMRELICEWLDFNAMRGFGQWRNSGKGRYHWEILEEKEADKA